MPAGGYGTGLLPVVWSPDGQCLSYIIAFAAAVIYFGIVLWKHHNKKRKQEGHHKNADSIHRKEKNERRAKGKDNLISFMVAIVVLVSIFVAYMIYIHQYWVLPYIFWGILIILILYGTYRIIHDFTNPDFTNPSSSSREIKVPDDKLMCKNGHIVSVFVDYDGGITQGHHNLDVTCGASVWPEKCPICGASWLKPGK